MLLAFEIQPVFWGEFNWILLGSCKINKVRWERNLSSSRNDDVFEGQDWAVPLANSFLSWCIRMQSQSNAVGDTCR